MNSIQKQEDDFRFDSIKVWRWLFKRIINNDNCLHDDANTLGFFVYNVSSIMKNYWGWFDNIWLKFIAIIILYLEKLTCRMIIFRQAKKKNSLRCLGICSLFTEKNDCWSRCETMHIRGSNNQLIPMRFGWCSWD